MSVKWIALSADDLQSVLAAPIISAAATALPNGDTLADKAILRAVNRVRAAIVKGNRTALSLTTGTTGQNQIKIGSVPPEGEQHTLALACKALVASVPEMGAWAEKDSFKDLVKAAEEWLEAVASGKPTDDPTDPDPTNTPKAVRWSDIYGADSDYAQGYYTTPEGVKITLPNDDMTVQ